MNWRKPVIHIVLYLSRSEVPSYLKEIERVEKYSLAKIKEYQESKLANLLLYAYRNVPYYHDILGKARVIQGNKVNLEYFQRIPVLTKQELRQRYQQLKSRDCANRSTYVNHSGGSTGEPIKFLQDRSYWHSNVANKIYYAKKNGKTIGQPEIKLWGSDRDIMTGSVGWKAKLQNFLYNRRFINCFDMDSARLDHTVKTINTFKPTLLWGYVNCLEILADYINENRIQPFSPRIIFSAAGTLTKDTRMKIQNAFHSPVINIYGTREVGDLAFELNGFDGLFITDYSHKVEVMNNSIIITTLHNYSMPLIRYQVGDVTSGLSQPEPDAPLPFNMLKDVLGRETDIIITKSGKRIPPEYFIHMIGVAYNTGFIKRFQLIQKSPSHILVKIVLAGRKQKNRMADIENAIRIVMGRDCRIEWKFVDDIPHNRCGKFQYTISEVR